MSCSLKNDIALLDGVADFLEDKNPNLDMDRDALESFFQKAIRLKEEVRQNSSLSDEVKKEILKHIQDLIDSLDFYSRGHVNIKDEVMSSAGWICFMKILHPDFLKSEEFKGYIGLIQALVGCSILAEKLEPLVDKLSLLTGS